MTIEWFDDLALGMRFASKDGGMKRLEIVHTAATDDETVAACAAVGRRMAWKVVMILEGKTER